MTSLRRRTTEQRVECHEGGQSVRSTLVSNLNCYCTLIWPPTEHTGLSSAEIASPSESLERCRISFHQAKMLHRPQEHSTTLRTALRRPNLGLRMRRARLRAEQRSRSHSLVLHRLAEVSVTLVNRLQGTFQHTALPSCTTPTLPSTLQSTSDSKNQHHISHGTLQSTSACTRVAGGGQRTEGLACRRKHEAGQQTARESADAAGRGDQALALRGGDAARLQGCAGLLVVLSEGCSGAELRAAGDHQAMGDESLRRPER